MTGAGGVFHNRTILGPGGPQAPMPAAFSFCHVMCCPFGANQLPESRTHHPSVNAASSLDDEQQVLPHLAAAQRGMRWFSYCRLLCQAALAATSGDNAR